MLVSVIIPTYNRPEFTQEAIDSVLGQTFQDLELIVIDDGSEPESRKWNVERRTRVYYRPHLGVSAARNFGVSVSQGKYIAFLDSDDLWLPRKLEKQIKFLEELRRLVAGSEERYKICYTNEKWLRKGHHLNQMKKHQKFGGWIFEKCLPLCIISASSIIMERAVFDELGGFDEALPVCEDYDLWLRLALRYPIGYLDEKLIVKRGGHPDQLSKKYWGMDRFRIQALEKLLNMNLSEEKQELVLQEIKKKSAILTRGALKRKSKNSTGPSDRAEF
jgi:glycosyltransferase involved in cell wall biosynthesis